MTETTGGIAQGSEVKPTNFELPFDPLTVSRAILLLYLLIVL